MSKVILSVKEKPFGQGISNLDVVLHTGARVRVTSAEPVIVQTKVDETLTDQELINWYRSRYNVLGLIVKVLPDDPKVNDEKTIEKTLIEEPLEKSGMVLNENNTIVKYSEIASEFDSSVVDTKKDYLAEDNALYDAIVAEESTAVSKVESKDSVENWAYSKMIEYAKENKIVVGGRGKDLYIKAIKEFRGC